MEYFLVRADVFGLEFPPEGSFRASALYFRPTKLPRYLRSVDRRLYHIKTGEAYIFVCSPHWTEAIGAVQFGTFRVASELLTFAQSHKVFFDNIKCEDENRIFMPERQSRIGFPFSGNDRIAPEKVPLFLEETLPKVTSRRFGERTRVFEAISWLNETILSAGAIEELRYTMLWLALDTLVSAFLRGSPEERLLSNREMKSLSSNVTRWSAKNLSNAKSKKLVDNLARLNQKTAFERIVQFLKQHDIPFDEQLVARVVRTRNLIHHIPWKARGSLEQVYAHLENLVETSICSVMGLDPEKYLRSRR